jgi:putative flippase GtrA
MINRTTVNYLIFGFLTTVINIVVFAIFIHAFQLDYKIATTVAWIASVIFAFFTNKFYVFNSKVFTLKVILKEFVNFSFYRVLSLLIDILLMFLLIDLADTNEMSSKVLVNIIVVILNYVTSKYLTFRN